MNIQETVETFKTKNTEGFTNPELGELLKQFPGMNMDKYYSAMTGNTCMMIDGEMIFYHCDIITAIRCGVENRDIRLSEWD